MWRDVRAERRIRQRLLSGQREGISLEHRKNGRGHVIAVRRHHLQAQAPITVCLGQNGLSNLCRSLAGFCNRQHGLCCHIARRNRRSRKHHEPEPCDQQASGMQDSCAGWSAAHRAYLDIVPRLRHRKTSAWGLDSPGIPLPGPCMKRAPLPPLPEAEPFSQSRRAKRSRLTGAAIVSKHSLINEDDTLGGPPC